MTSGVKVAAAPRTGSSEILTDEALGFLSLLHAEFEPRRQDILDRRRKRAAELVAGGSLGFLESTAPIRDDPSWQVAAPAPGLSDRRVEITGPVDAKMTINALNSGAKVWLADFEDATTPTWDNVVAGQLNLREAIKGDLAFSGPDGRTYNLRGGDQPTIVVRPRGWHLNEQHLLVDDTPIAGALVDFGLYVFHSAALQLARGSGPYFYLPKLESHLEARLWNDVFVRAQELLGIPRGTIRATVLIETYPAAFEMEEILYELREHSAGLNAGRWDFLFSVIKCFGTAGRQFLLPDRNAVTMTAPFLRAYTELLVATCHRRGAHAIGGMAAFVPSRRNPEINANALAKVRDDKTREAGDGFDGSWVAHPDLVPVCKEVFDGVLGDRPDQRHRLRDDVSVAATDLLDVSSTPGAYTQAGLRNNVSVAVQYIAAWLGGRGAVAINNLMEDAATAEIARSQVWQWLFYDVTLDDGTQVTRELVERVIDEEYSAIREAIGTEAFESARFAEARELFAELVFGEELTEFLTLPAYDRL
jgi:malate synthase